MESRRVVVSLVSGLFLMVILCVIGGTCDLADAEQCIGIPPGDINFDCVVDMRDFAIVATNWLGDYSEDPNYNPSNVIYVSSSDVGAEDVAGCGREPNSPCMTIGWAIAEAVTSGRSEVYVADGLYEETVTLVDGISVRGGFTANTWQSHLETTSTILTGNSGATLHKKTIVASNISSETVLEGLVIYGQSNYETGGNSYVVWAKNSPGLTILSNRIIAGIGGDGADGPDGDNGGNGLNGSTGMNAKNTTYDCYGDCVGLGETAGGIGGQSNWGGTNANGGNGADSGCPDYDEGENNCTTCISSPYTQSEPLAGQNGQNSGGAGGTSGYDGYLDGYCAGDCGCYVPQGQTMEAGDGIDGSTGDHGYGGAGGTNVAGQVLSDEWQGYFGYSGTNGAAGSGGGGGGAGGGVETGYDSTCPTDGRSDIGGSGGGGGAGGCGGERGGSGSYGGGAFGIFIVDGNTPIISDNYIILGNAGRGGSGGNGGVGGSGGIGAQGGSGGLPGTDYWCAKDGGKGGDGGSGGNGGGGGGGCGGSSYGIYTFSVSESPDYEAENTFAGGAGGVGGSGGVSMSNPGSDGVTGELVNCAYR